MPTAAAPASLDQVGRGGAALRGKVSSQPCRPKSRFLASDIILQTRPKEQIYRRAWIMISFFLCRSSTGPYPEFLTSLIKQPSARAGYFIPSCVQRAIFGSRRLYRAPAPARRLGHQLLANRYEALRFALGFRGRVLPKLSPLKNLSLASVIPAPRLPLWGRRVSPGPFVRTLRKRWVSCRDALDSVHLMVIFPSNGCSPG